MFTVDGVRKTRLVEQLLPCHLDFAQRGHVSHGTPRPKVGEDHGLAVGGENISRFSHEVDAAENDVLGVRFGRLLTEHERVAEEISVHDDAVPLVVVAEDEQIITQLFFQFLNSVGNGLLFNGQRGVHEVDRTHREGHRHGSHQPQRSTLFEGTDGRIRSKRRPW